MGESIPADLDQGLAQLSLMQLGYAQRLVGGEARLLQRVAERVVPDVVQQGRETDRQAVLLRHLFQLTALLQTGQRPAGQVIGAEGMLETGVGGAGVYQKGMADLAHVAEAL